MHSRFFLIPFLLHLSTALVLQNDSRMITLISRSFTGQGEQTRGWMPSPNDRGTLDILWSCIVTLFLCCWSMLCLNVPASTHSPWAIFRKRVLLFLGWLVAPEFIGVTVTGQYFSARQSVKDFAAAGISEWTLQHAYIADMGGFVVQTRDWVPFPINAKQLLWLIQHGYISVPRIELRRINDKNKVDSMMRFVMLVQTIWFIINICVRMATGLAVTALELTTMSSIYLSWPCMFMWRHKPADVGTTEVLTTEASISEILLAGGDAAHEPYDQTPLDFISRKEWMWSKYWAHLTRVFQRLHISIGSQNRPVDHFSNVLTPEVPFWVFRCGAVAMLGWAGIFMIGWNFKFPTKTEQLLWRVSCTLIATIFVVGDLSTVWVFNCWPFIKRKWPWIWNNGKSEPSTNSPGSHRGGSVPQSTVPMQPSVGKRTRGQPRTVWDRIRNNSVSQDHEYTVPLRIILPIWFLGCLYMTARIYILIEDFLELRSLPLSAYKTVEWGQFLFHFS